LHRLPKIDQDITSAIEPLAHIAATLEMPLVCDLTDELAIARLGYAGLYRIDVCTAGAETSLADWVAAFRRDWEDSTIKIRATPSLKKKRIGKHSTLPEWMPLYLGKSRNVASRVLEHINLPQEKTTFALKLKARPALQSRTFRLHAVELPVQNYDVIAPALECALRDRLHPLIGKQ
jgi:hypothetical protein